MNEFLNTISQKCLLIEKDKDINPLENYLFFVNKTFDVKTVDGEKYISVSIEDYSMPKKWFEQIVSRSNSASKYIYKPSNEDIKYIYLLIYLNSLKTNSFYKNNLEKYIYSIFNSTDKAVLTKSLLDFLVDNSFIVDKDKYLDRLYRAPLKSTITENILLYKVVFHTKFTFRPFIRKIAHLFPNYEIKHIKNAVSSTGCTFLKVSNSKESLFIKGNELKLFKCLQNEIIIQKKLKNVNNNHILKMVNYDENEEWISYPYLEYKTIANIISTRKLNNSELDRLGSFLEDILDFLYKNSIIHRDLRIHNIMAINNDREEIVDFLLMDFGDGVLNGNDIWKEDNLFNNYLKEQVCSENRYSKYTVDDASSALLLYLKCGGNENDSHYINIKERIGRIFI